ncbi:hypothetical protein FKB34_09010 [Glycocaulis profundi]|nr:hypothetical protein FKB34_09010 [Glycocaulis profundi]
MIVEFLASLTLVSTISQSDIGRWQKNCTTDDFTDEVSCRASYSGTTNQGRGNVYSMSVSHSESDGWLYLIVVSRAIHSGLDIRVDDQPALRGQCVSSACLVSGSDAANLVRQMREGQQILIRVTSPSLRTEMQERISLSGFTAALD